jgi:FixJ family two-component response regulator
MATTHVAVVDDEAQVRRALRRLLRLADYDVATYDSGDGFLASLAHQVPDCALLDVNMPGVGGLQVLAKLRCSHSGIPVVVITASDDPAVERDALQCGALRVLHKPFGQDEMLAAVEFALRSASPP